LANEIRNREATASSWRTWPKVNVRRKVPKVEGARIPVNNRPIPPCRSRSMSSMESAPATIPATNAGIFRCAFAPPSEELPFLLGDAADAVEMVLTHGLTAAQQKFHAPA
jgi:hypothetical protein